MYGSREGGRDYIYIIPETCAFHIQTRQSRPLMRRLSAKIFPLVWSVKPVHQHLGKEHLRGVCVLALIMPPSSTFVVNATDVYVALGPTSFTFLHLVFERMWTRYQPHLKFPLPPPVAPDASSINSSASGAFYPPAGEHRQYVQTQQDRLPHPRASYRFASADIELVHLMRKKQQQQSQCDGNKLTETVRMQFGINLEQHIFAWYHQLRMKRVTPHEHTYAGDVPDVQMVEHDDNLHCLKMGQVDPSSGVCWEIHGKLDGKQLEADGTLSVLEIKNRMSGNAHTHLMHHEYLQLQTYLHLMPHTTRGCLVDSCVDPHPTHSNTVLIQLNLIETQRNDELWNEFVVPRLRALVELCVRWSRDPAAIARYQRYTSHERNHCLAQCMNEWESAVDRSTKRHKTTQLDDHQPQTQEQDAVRALEPISGCLA